MTLQERKAAWQGIVSPGVGGVGVGGRWVGEVLGGVETANIRLGKRRVEKKV